MQYLLLIYSDESKMGAATQADKNAMFKEYGEYTASIIKSGNMKAGGITLRRKLSNNFQRDSADNGFL